MSFYISQGVFTGKYPFDRRFAKVVVNFISSLRTWEFQYVTVNQMANFETSLGIRAELLGNVAK